MNQRRAKQIRKVFKDRYQYRTFKKAYTQAPIDKQLEVNRRLDIILASGKVIKTMEI